jgi:hypothetical protein
LQSAVQRTFLALSVSALLHALLIAVKVPGPRYLGTDGKTTVARLNVRLSVGPGIPEALKLARHDASGGLAHKNKRPTPSAKAAQSESNTRTLGSDEQTRLAGSLLHPDPYIPADDLDTHPDFLVAPPEMLYGSSLFNSGRLFALLRIDEFGHLDDVEVEYSDFDEQAIAEIVERLRASRYRPGMLKGKAVASRWRLVFDVSLAHSSYKLLLDESPADQSSASPINNR